MTSVEMLKTAERNVQDILTFAIEHTTQNAMVIFDTECDLAITLTEAYKQALPNARFLDFKDVTIENIRADFAQLSPGDLVVLIQSTSFRLNKFRIRVDLFNRNLKCIEHPHLSRMNGEDEENYYIDSLAYDKDYYRNVGAEIKKAINACQTGIVDTHEAELTFTGGFEPAKLNVGDYREMRNIGGQFPIGEVFTEALDLEAVNGKLKLFAFGDTSYKVNIPEKPITLIIEKGRVVNTIDSTPEFDLVLENIRRDEEGEVWVRELGFGMNRAFTRKRTVTDIGTYERMCGIHLSLGAKHNVYKKPEFKFSPRTAKHHVDIFADTKAVLLDGKNIYQNESWQINL